MTRLRVAAVLIVVAAWSPIAAAQSSGAEWIAWARDHSYPIAATAPVTDDDYSDLQFFKQVIGDRRLVQLGESGHGVGQFDSAKVRLVKFFHEQMGFVSPGLFFSTTHIPTTPVIPLRQLSLSPPPPPAPPPRCSASSRYTTSI